MLSLLRPQVQSLVRELRAHKQHRKTKKQNKTKPKKPSYFPDASTPLQRDGKCPVQATLHTSVAMMVLSRPLAYPMLTMTKRHEKHQWNPLMSLTVCSCVTLNKTLAHRSSLSLSALRLSTGAHSPQRRLVALWMASCASLKDLWDFPLSYASPWCYSVFAPNPASEY